jgi:hypothetical protein
MAEQQYVLSHTADAAERERLALWEHIEDARSQRHLAALGIQQGWRCLEVGAGHGSIARWLAEQVGLQGWIAAHTHPSALPDCAAVAQRRGAAARYPYRSLGSWQV